MQALLLLAIAGVHVAWGRGSTWPYPDRDGLNDAVIGRDATPSAPACYAVAAALTTAAVLVSGQPVQLPLRRLGAAGVVTVLAARGALGVVGRTDLAVPGSVSPRFRQLDRRWLGPFCSTLAALSTPRSRAGDRPREHEPGRRWLVVTDVVLKGAVVVLLAFALTHSDWDRFADKAMGARAVLYPLLIAVPAVMWLVARWQAGGPAAPTRRTLWSPTCC